MFGSLKKKLKESVQKLSKKTEEEIVKETRKEEVKKSKKKKEAKRSEKQKVKPIIEKKPEVIEEVVEEHVEREEPKKKLGFRQKLTTKEFSAKDVDNFFEELEVEMLQANVALEVVEALKNGLKENLVGKQIKRGKAEETISSAFYVADS